MSDTADLSRLLTLTPEGWHGILRMRERTPAHISYLEIDELIEEVLAQIAKREETEKERDEARKWGEQVAAKYNAEIVGIDVTCAFCGHTFPRGTPRDGDGRLTEHIKVCPQHPMRQAEAGTMKGCTGAGGSGKAGSAFKSANLMKGI